MSRRVKRCAVGDRVTVRPSAGTRPDLRGTVLIVQEPGTVTRLTREDNGEEVNLTWNVLVEDAP